MNRALVFVVINTNIRKTVNEIGKATFNTGKFILNVVRGAANRAVQLSDRTTRGAGQAADFVTNLPFVRRFAGILRLDWLVGMSDRVDLAKAEAEVKKLQQQHSDESPAQIAHRIMVQKAIQAGKVGLATSILPGFAVAFLAIDLAATTVIQTEMLYQIAATYGLDLRDPARKGEILAIFGLALGGGKAVRAGLGFMRNVPLAGALIGASTNATMLYSLGYAACRFYEAKLQAATDQPTDETMQALQQESEKYLDVAIAQQAVMDQILVHMIVASYPNKTWESILPELKGLQLDPNSLNTIEANIRSPEPLGALLQQLNCDYAIPLLTQCRQIAERDGEISTNEAEILEAVSERCEGKLELA